MIGTKDLIEYVRTINTGNAGVTDVEVKYRTEIVARLCAYDKLKEGIEELCYQLTSVVDSDK